MNVAENTTAVTTVAATDADLPAQTLTYSISGGADAAKFSINSSTGVLTFVSAPDFESPTDAGGNNVYDVTVQVSDGFGGTDSQDIAVTVTNVNEVLVVSTTGSALVYTENQVATAVDSGLTVSDDNTNLTGATVSISANYANGQDVLAFTNQLGITGSWDAGTGILTLTGTTTVANYQTALRSITYVNTSDSPSALTRTVSFVVNDGTSDSVDATRDIAVTATNDAPAFAALNAVSPYTEGGTAIVLDADVSVSDLELDALNGGAGNYSGATLTIARNGVVSANDSFGFNNGNGIIWSGRDLIKNSQVIATFDTTSTAGQLVITFTDANGEIPTSNDVDNILQQITYSNVSGNPLSSIQLDWTFSDENSGDQGTGGALTTTGSTTINIATSNNRPVLDLDADDSSGVTLGGYRTTYHIGAAPVAIADSDAVFSDAEDTVFSQGSIVSFTGFVDAGQEILTVGGEQFTIGTGRSASVVVGTTTFDLVSDGTDLQVTISAGTGAIADWQALVTGITYEHSGTPTDGDRSFIFFVRDSLSARSNIVESTIAVSSNHVPTFGGTLGGTVSFTEDGPSVVLDSDVTIFDTELSGADNFDGATLTLKRSGSTSSSDQFSATGTLSFNSGNVVLGATTIGTYVNGSGTLTITFNSDATNALVNQAMQQIAYSNSSNTPPASVQIAWTFDDGLGGQDVGLTTVNITAANDAPTLDLDNNNSSGATGSNYRGQYNAGGTPVIVADTDTGLTDQDSTAFTSGTISSLTGFVDAGQERLTIGGQQFTVGAVNSASVVVGGTTFNVVHNGTTFEITVTAGSGSNSAWVTLIEGMRYQHIGTPTNGDRSFDIVVIDSAGLASNTATSTISASSNRAPSFGSTLNGSVTFVENGAPVVIDNDVAITDPELTPLNDFNGASLTIKRSAASSQDVFSATGTLSLTGGNVIVGGTTIGTYTNGSGTLSMTFNANATNALVNSAMQQIAYSNSSEYPPASVSLQWTFSDGNSGSQGAGGALQVTNTKTITITSNDDAPISTDDSFNILQDTTRTVSTGDFGSYQDETTLQAVRITSTPSAGALEWFNGSNWTAVTVSQDISRADILAGNLRFVPNAGETGSPYTTIGFQVSDGTSWSVASYTLTVNVTANVTALNDAFLQGNYLEIGLNDGGTLVSDGHAPVGFNSAGDMLGAEVDSERDGWSTYDGDFITPGSPVEYWGVSIDGSAYANRSNGSDAISGSYSNFQSGQSGQSTEWAGSQSGLDVRQVYSVGANDLYLEFQIELTNNSGTALNDIYYYRDIDPDNNVDQGGTDNFNTTNTIVSQGNTSGISMVTATQVDGSYFAIQALGTNSRVTYGGFGNTDPVAIYNGSGSLQQSGSLYNDISVSVAYHFATIADGETVTMQIRYYFGEDDGDQPIVDLDADNSSGSLGGDFSTTFVEDSGAVNIADADATIFNPESPALDLVTVSITNLLDGAAEQLTAVTTGTKITAGYNSGTGVMTLTGLDSVANYRTVLRSIQYLNTSDAPDTTTRLIDVTASFEGMTSAAATSHVAVIATNDAPVISSDGGSSTASVNVAENTTAVTTVTSTDVDGGTASYSISGGADAAKFSINSSTGVLTFVSAPDFESPTDVGADNVYNVQVTVSDGVGGTDSQDISVTVADLDEFDVTAPVDTDGTSNAVNENAANGTTVGVTGFATDDDATTSGVTYSLFDDAGGRFAIDALSGVVTVADGSLLDREAAASHNITIRATSDDGSKNDTTFTVAVNDLNDTAPVVTAAQTFNVSEFAANATTVGLVLATDADTVGSLQNWAIVAGNVDGIFAINSATGALRVVDRSNLNFEFTPNYTLTVAVGDGVNTSASQNVSLAVTDENDPLFLIRNQGTVVVEGGSVVIGSADLLITDEDAAANQIRYTVTSAPTSGQLELTTNAGVAINSFTQEDINSARLRYVHGRSEFADSFIFNVTDGAGSSIIGESFNIDLLHVNDAPVNTVPGTQTTGEDTPLVFSVSSGNGLSVSDSDINQGNGLIGVRLTATNGRITLSTTAGLVFAVGAGTNNVDVVIAGTLNAVNAAFDGLTFSPDENFNGTATLRIVSRDMGNSGTGGELIDDSTIIINVRAINDAPVSTPDRYTTAEDNSLSVTAIAGVLNNDTDVDHDGLSAILVTGPSHGTLSLQSDGSFLYTPDANFNGTDSFSYVATDGALQTGVTPVTLTVTAVNDTPVAADDDYSVDQLKTLTLGVADGVLVNDFDVENDTLAALLVSGPNDGRLTLNADGTFTYTPDAAFFGEDSFVYRVNDGTANGTIGRVTITVNQTVANSGVNDQDQSDTSTPDDSPTNTENTDNTPDDPTTQTVLQVTVDASNADSSQSPQPQSVGQGFVTPAESSTVTNLDELTPFTDSEFDAALIASTVDFRSEFAREGTLPTYPIGFSSVTADPLEFLEDQQVVYVLQETGFWQELDTFAEHVAAATAENTAVSELVVESATVAGSALTVGYVLWLLRSGSVLVGLVSSLPAWTMMDPLPILEGGLAGDGMDDLLEGETEVDDSLQSILKQNSVMS